MRLCIKKKLITELSNQAMNVLLVEDQPVNQVVASEMIRRLGHEVTLAGNGLEAIKAISTKVFDLVFMDCQMPEMDGYTAASALKKLANEGEIPPCPIIALTAHAMVGDREKCIAAGMDDYLAKPIDNQELENIIKKWLGGDIPIKYELIDSRTIKSLRELMGKKFSKLVETYIANSQKTKTDILAAAAQGDMEKLGRAAHGLKGSAHQIGASNLAAKLSELETRATQNMMPDLTEIADLIDRVNFELKGLI
jgi:CheY-like chemotaxis protein